MTLQISENLKRSYLERTFVGIISCNRPQAKKEIKKSLKEFSYVNIYGNHPHLKGMTFGPSYYRYKIYQAFLHGKIMGIYDQCLIFDDDTIPRSTEDILKLIHNLYVYDCDVSSGVWNCKKLGDDREHASMLNILEEKFIDKKTTKTLIRSKIKITKPTKVDIPLTPLATNSERLFFHQNIYFFGDMLYFGLHCKNQDVKIMCDPSIILDHKRFPEINNFDPFKRNDTERILKEYGISKYIIEKEY